MIYEMRYIFIIIMEKFGTLNILSSCMHMCVFNFFLNVHSVPVWNVLVYISPICFEPLSLCSGTIQTILVFHPESFDGD